MHGPMAQVAVNYGCSRISKMMPGYAKEHVAQRHQERAMYTEPYRYSPILNPWPSLQVRREKPSPVVRHGNDSKLELDIKLSITSQKLQEASMDRRKQQQEIYFRLDCKGSSCAGLRSRITTLLLNMKAKWKRIDFYLICFLCTSMTCCTSS